MITRLLSRRSFLRSSLAAPAIIGLSGAALAQVPGRVNPLPGLTGLGANALPGLISPVSASASGAPAGIPTNVRWSTTDIGAAGVLSNDNRTFTSSLGISAGVRSAQSYRSGKYFFPITIDLSVSGAVGAVFGLADASTSLVAWGTGGNSAQAAGTTALAAIRQQQMPRGVTGSFHVATAYGGDNAAPRFPLVLPASFGVAADFDLGYGWFLTPGGGWYGDPAKGTNPVFTWTPTTLYLFGLADDGNTDQLTIPLTTPFASPAGFLVA